MKEIKTIGIFLFLMILFISCDCVQDVYGTVLDNETLEPIDSAFVQKQSNEAHYGYSDVNGHFEVESVDGGLSFGCPSMTVELKKEGYETATVEIGNGSHQKVFLKKVKERK